MQYLNKDKLMLIEDDSLILFQGDSITDAGRSYEIDSDLGRGYANLIGSWLSAQYPTKQLRFLNRGISGNCASDLRNRWQRDCLDLQPDWVSILIGINDTWRRYDSNLITTVEEYAAHYRAILQQTRDSGARIIILEPFVLPIPDDRVKWREDLDPKIAIARQLAREFADAYVALDGIFATASVQRSMDFWLPDGVHPSSAGHALIAQNWLKTINAL